MQRRWEEQLAAYVTASFRVIKLGNVASQSVQFVNKVVTAATLFFGAKLVIEGSLTVGELVAFNILAGRVSAPVLRLAQMWQGLPSGRACRWARLGDILNTRARADLQSRANLPAGDPGHDRDRTCDVPLSHRRSGNPCMTSCSTFRPVR